MMDHGNGTHNLTLWQRIRNFGRKLHRNESGEGNLVSVVGIAAAVGLAIALIKPYLIIAFEQGGAALIEFILRAGSSAN